MITKKPTNNGKALIKTIKLLRVIFREDYPDGGWLPPVREMADRFGVSLMTYHKAISRMVSERFVQSYPKKGYYVVPDHLRCRKIGLIFEDGATSPFIGECRDISSILEVLNTHHFAAQILQFATYDHLYDLALAHGIEGLLWFDPPYPAKETIHDIDQDGEFPLTVIQLRLFESGELFGKGTVSYDRKRIAGQRAKFLKHLGHQQVIYTGRNYEEALEDGSIDAYSKHGIRLLPEHFIKAPHDEPERLTQMLESQHPTVVMSEGGSRMVDHLFGEITRMPHADRPEVFVSEFPLLPALFKRYPKVKPVPQQGRRRPEIGRLAATMLMEHLLEGKEIHRMSVSESYDI